MRRQPYLEVTYHKGKPLAAYIHLPHAGPDEVARSHKADSGMVVDYNDHDLPVGIEITDPAAVSASDVNALLVQLHQTAMAEEELTPLLKAG